MTREKLIKIVVELAASDMINIGVTEEDLIAEANKLTNEELKNYIEGN